MKVALDFDDILLEPQYSDIDSRSDVMVGTILGTLHLKVPIISANMSTVTDGKMAVAIGKAGGLGILHRYAKPQAVLGWIEECRKAGVYAVPSIGIQFEDYQKAQMYSYNGAHAICIDVAHGHHKNVGKMVEFCRNQLDFGTVIAGNVATEDGAKFLIDHGANVIKVGVGPGSVCTTRYVTGHGVPQVTAINNVSMEAVDSGCYVIADGGIKNSGDIVKALAVGAHAVMLGKLLAGCDEAPGDWDSGTDMATTKNYNGMASAEEQNKFRGKVNNDAPEGVSSAVLASGPVASVIKQLVGGIRSGMSYSGVRSIPELQQNAIIVNVNRVK